MLKGEESAKAAGERFRFGDENFAEGQDSLVHIFGLCG